MDAGADSQRRKPLPKEKEGETYPPASWCLLLRLEDQVSLSSETDQCGSILNLCRSSYVGINIWDDRRAWS